MATKTFEPPGNTVMKHALSHTGVVASFHTSTNYVIIGLDNGSIHIFSRTENKIINVFQHDCAVWAFDVCDETNTLVAGGAGGELNVWDLATG
jgi:WD40 repeat protein